MHRAGAEMQKSHPLRPRLTLSFFTSNGQPFKRTTAFNLELISEYLIVGGAGGVGEAEQLEVKFVSHEIVLDQETII